MAKKSQLPSTFEFTGNTRKEGEQTFNQFIQRDSKGREVSVATNNAMYVHNVTLNEQIDLSESTTLDFLASHPEGKYSIQTKLKDGRIFHGELTQVPHPEKEEESAPEELPERIDSTDTASVNSVDQAEQASEESSDEPSENNEGDKPEESADENPAEGEGEKPEEPVAEDKEEGEEYIVLRKGEEEASDQDNEQPEEPIQGGDVIRYSFDSSEIEPTTAVQEAFESALQQLSRNDTVNIHRNGELLVSLSRVKKDSQYGVEYVSTDNMTDEEAAALNAVSRRIITGQVQTKRG